MSLGFGTLATIDHFFDVSIEEIDLRKKNNVVFKVPVFLNFNFHNFVVRTFFFGTHIEEKKMWNTRQGNVWRVCILNNTLSDILISDVRRHIMYYYIAIIKGEETRCKLPTLFCCALHYSGALIHKQSIARFETHASERGYCLAMPLATKYKTEMELDATLIEDHGETSHFMVLNLMALLRVTPTMGEYERRLETTLLVLAKRFGYGDVLWFYVKHSLGLTAESIPITLIDKKSRALLVTFLLSCRESEIIFHTVVYTSFESRIVSLYRLLITLFLADKDYVACLPLVKHVEKTLHITESHFYLDSCRIRYPTAYTQLMNETTVYLSS